MKNMFSDWCAQNITSVAQAAQNTTQGASNCQQAASELARMAAELQLLGSGGAMSESTGDKPSVANRAGKSRPDGRLEGAFATATKA